MGFLKKYFTNVLHEAAATELNHHSSFDHLTEQQLEAHLGVARYGNFRLTDAVRPSFDLQVTPREGYRHDVYRDDQSKTEVPVLMAAASQEAVFELFLDLIDPLGNTVDVVLETSHERDAGGHIDLYREHMDMPVLKSVLWEYEDLLLNDGCTGIAVLNPNIPQEVQFDEHKLLIIYGRPLERFEHLLERYGVRCDEQIKFITEAEHVHSSNDEFLASFDQLKTRLGMDSGYASV